MKLKICRASGLPVKWEEIEQYNEAYRALYDKIKNHVAGERNILSQEENTRMGRLLNRLGPKVLKRFALMADLNTTGSKKAWLELVAQHGPIALAKNSENGDLVAVIMDAEFGG